RRLPQRALAGEPAPGPARLLRRPHLRAHRPAARQILPHQLDGQGRQRVCRNVHRLGPGMNADITQKASRIRLLLMDVDGVLTDGKLYNVPGPDGKMAETKGFDSQDGIALQWMARVGIATGLISGRVSPATVERATQCKFKYIYQGHTEKIPIL